MLPVFCITHYYQPWFSFITGVLLISHFAPELTENTRNPINNTNPKCISGILNLGLGVDFRRHFKLHVNCNEYIEFYFFEGGIFTVVVKVMKSSVPSKSEVYYYGTYCRTSLILPRRMKLIEGRNPNLNIVLK